MSDEKDTKQEETTTEETQVEEKVEEKKEEAKEEATAPAGDASSDAGEDVEVPAKFKSIVDSIENMSVIDLHELVKLLEKKFGVSAVAVATVGASSDAGAGAEEKSDFIVHLSSIGDQKIGVIKAVKAALGLGLKEAKELVESAPVDLKSGVPTEEANALKAEIEGVGGSVELK